MERIKNLNRYQKGILLFMTAMALVFAVVYSITISREGFAYKDKIFVPIQENGSMVYYGKIKGQQAHFTVSVDKTVQFQCGDKSYGPYTAKEDPAAVPTGEEMAEYMTGVELYEGEDILFRGGILDHGDSLWLYDEDGNLADIFAAGNGAVMDENWSERDPAEPSAAVIFELMNEPDMTHKGEWSVWFYAAFICVLNACSILFADELFRWNLGFQIRNADRAEPSDWQIAGRYIGWTAISIVALAFFFAGLQ